MKKLVVMLALVLALGALYAQEEQLLTPESALTLKDGEYVRHLSGEQFMAELDRYEAENRISHNATVTEVEPEKYEIEIPMAPQDRQDLQLQSEMFVKNAVDFKNAEMVRGTYDNYEMKLGYNKIWGKKSTFAAYVDALLRIYGDKQTRTLNSHFNAGGYVFNKQVKAVEFNMNMCNNNGNPTASTALRLFGKTKFSYSGTTVYKKMYYQGEFSKKARFFLGPVPVSVRGAIGGSAGFDARVSVVSGGIQGSLTPGITSYGKADAGVDLWFAKAGVEGHLDLLIDSLPVTLTTRLLSDNRTLEIALKVTNNLKALAGKVVVFAKVKQFWKFWKKSWKTYKKTLFSWSGIKKNWVLYSKSYKISLK